MLSGNKDFLTMSREARRLFYVVLAAEMGMLPGRILSRRRCERSLMRFVTRVAEENGSGWIHSCSRFSLSFGQMPDQVGHDGNVGKDVWVISKAFRYVCGKPFRLPCRRPRGSRLRLRRLTGGRRGCIARHMEMRLHGSHIR